MKSKSFLTAPILISDPDEFFQNIQDLPEEIQVLEIWIDCWNTSFHKAEKVEAFFKKFKQGKKKLLAVCKDPIEKGKWKGDISHKIEILLSAAKGGADFVDLGLHNGKKALESLRLQLPKQCQYIVSHHDFEKTPAYSRLQKIINRMETAGADICKIATQVKSIQEGERLMHLALHLKEKNLPHIILGMGNLGVVTRLFSDTMGNHLNFVSIGKATAPGQLSLEQVLNFRKVL